MNINELYNKYEQQKEIYDDLKFQLETEIDKFISDLYKIKTKYKPFSDNYEFLSSTKNYQSEWEIEKITGETYISCHWSESWQYGGHDSGYFSFPLYFILEPKRFELWKQKLDKEYQEWKTKFDQSNYNKKLEQFEQLKKELNIKE